MKSCPQCITSVEDDVLECPKCGILFSKWKERETNVSSGNLSKYSQIANATSSEFNWTILGVVVLAIIGVIVFIAQSAHEALKDI